MTAFTVAVGPEEHDPVTGRARVQLTVEYTPPPPPPPPPVPPLLVGIAAYRPDLGVKDDAEFGRIQSLLGGALAVRRGFSPVFPSTWAGHTSSKDPTLGARASVTSVKSDVTRMAQGRDDALVAGFVRSIPDAWPVTLIWQHEPDNPDKAIDPGNYRAGAARFAQVVKATARPEQNVQVGWCVMGWTFVPASGRDPDDWYPGDDAVDIVCPDPYSFTTTRPALFTDPDVGAVAAHRYAVERFKTFGVAEWGCFDLPGTNRPAFIQSGDRWLREVGAVFACWFHSGRCALDTTAASMVAFTAHTTAAG